MKKPIFAALATAFLSAGNCYAQLPQAAAAGMRAKNLLEFHKAAVANPTNVLLLAVEIRSLFRSDGARYGALNNGTAAKLGLFDNAPNGLSIVEVGPRASQSSPHGYFFIALKELSFKECAALAGHSALQGNFVSVEVNGTPLAGFGPAACKSQLPFQRGKNTITFISY